jgi:lysyl-tRNA synthetase class 2
MPRPSPNASPWWAPHVHADRRPFLLARNRIVAALRGFFCRARLRRGRGGGAASLARQRGASPRFRDRYHCPGRGALAAYLHTSPEFACKKLLAAGERRIFDVARVFRNRERGPLHHPEFTLLEWYRAGEPYEALMQDCAEILALTAETAGARALTWRGRSADPFAPPERLTLAEAFLRFAGIDLLATLDATVGTDRDALSGAARAAGVRVAADDTWSDVFSRVSSSASSRILARPGHHPVRIPRRRGGPSASKGGR